MSNYRRMYVPNGTYFFTVVTHNRIPLFANLGNVEKLRHALGYTVRRLPFSINAIVILPDHLHCIWTMTTDNDFSKRWWMIKAHFSRGLNHESRKHAQTNWQNRFWEHLIRDPDDLRRTWITFITTRSNMAMWRSRLIGQIAHSANSSRAAFTTGIGEVPNPTGYMT